MTALEDLYVKLAPKYIPPASRDKAAAEGKANSDGSFPIRNLDELKRAIQSFGRASDKAKTAKLIVKRAAALNYTDVPDSIKEAAKGGSDSSDSSDKGKPFGGKKAPPFTKKTAASAVETPNLDKVLLAMRD
jgi:hypothetical protein